MLDPKSEILSRISRTVDKLDLAISGDGGEENVGVVRNIDALKREIKALKEKIGMAKWFLCLALTAGAYALADRLLDSAPPAAAHVQAVDTVSSLLSSAVRSATTRSAN